MLFRSLIALPGVGDYTASAVLAFAFAKRSTVLDTNIRRVISRVWHGQQYPASNISAAEKSFAQGLVPSDDATAAQWSAAVMELGAVVCTARIPQCSECPISQRCAWQGAGAPHSQTIRRTQTFEGTDRQIRGRMMRKLREATGSLQRQDLLAVCDDAARAAQVLDSLVVDGLAEVTRAGRLRLPH